MIAQPKTFEPALTVISTEPEISDLTFDDLADLQQSIAALFRAKERGEDMTEQLAAVQKSIKCLAVEFGIIPEIYAQQDKQLKQSGLKTAIVPMTA